MANIFISYGDDNFSGSLFRIKLQAKKLKLFDKIIIYTPKDLPIYVKSSPLMAFSQGGGYWVWKPYIIYETLKKCQEGDIVIYTDAGCSLRAGKEWEEYLSYLESYNAIFFHYREGFDYGWGDKYCSDEANNNPQIMHWTKPSCLEYFHRYYKNDEYFSFNKIPSGFFIVRKTRNILNVIDDWFKIAIFHPELFIEPYGAEKDNLPCSFNAHRYEQSVLTLLVYYYQKKDNLLVLPERLESDRNHAVVAADRYRAAKSSFCSFLKLKLYYLIHYLLLR